MLLSLMITLTSVGASSTAAAMPGALVPAPEPISEAAGVLGLTGEAQQVACSLLPVHGDAEALIPLPEGWFAEGRNGKITRAERNGESVPAEHVIQFLQSHAAQHSGEREPWSAYLLWLMSQNCGNGFAFCIVILPGLPGRGPVEMWCAMCCSGVGHTPYASCDANHLTATCRCV